MSTIQALHPVWQALIAGLFTWFCTLLGSATVFFTKRMDESFLSLMQGFAAGVMMAASFWSLLNPALEYAAIGDSPLPVWLPVTIGFLLGGAFLRLLDIVVPHIHYAGDHGDTNLKKTSLSRTMMLFLAVTIHNIPEGLALGVAFAAASLGLNQATFAGALSLLWV